MRAFPAASLRAATTEMPSRRRNGTPLQVNPEPTPLDEAAYVNLAGAACCGHTTMVEVVHAASHLSGLPELTDIRKVWFSDWYDGPITGVAVHDGREYLFVMVTDDDGGGGGSWNFEPRIYVLHSLPGEQLAQAWEMHRTFAAAGLPGCLHSRPCTIADAPHGETVAALRDRWPPECEYDYQNAPAVGWFRDA